MANRDQLRFQNNPRVDRSLRATVFTVGEMGTDGKAKVTVTITAFNGTKKTILLIEPYYIKVKRASAVSAFDVTHKQPLHAIYDSTSDRIQVEFAPKTALASGDTLTYSVSFTAQFRKSTLKTKDGHDLCTGIFVVEPLGSYRDVPIRNHRIEKMRFLFPSLRDSNVWSEPVVEQSNNHQIRSESRKRPKGVELVFDTFDLPIGADPMRITFCYFYRSCPIVEPSRPRKIWADYGKPTLSELRKIVIAILPTVLIEAVKDWFRR